jgi:hypothetical protein
VNEWREVERKHAIKVICVPPHIGLMVRVDGEPVSVTLLHHGETQALVNDIIIARDKAASREVK